MEGGRNDSSRLYHRKGWCMMSVSLGDSEETPFLVDSFF